MRYLLIMSLLCTVTACVGPPRDQRQGRPKLPDKSVSADTRQCFADLVALRARYTPVPDQDLGNGCSTRGAVQLLDAGVPVTNVRAVRCDVARTLALWIRDSVQPAARESLGSRVVKIETMGAYACRNVIGNAAAAGNRSEHATANAIDIGAFLLADGRRVSVVEGWNGDRDERQFLRLVRAGACKRFQTVLSPDYNAAHHDHLHFDLGSGPFCR